MQLTAMLTKNDYFNGLLWYSIKRNTDLVSGIALDQGELPEAGVNELVITFNHAITEYLSLVKDPGGITTFDYKDAITAFAPCRET